MWWHHDLGSVRERQFGDLGGMTPATRLAWPVSAARPRQIGRPLRFCRDFDICGGNTRKRAQLGSSTATPGARTPAATCSCSREIGVASSEQQRRRGPAHDPAGGPRCLIPTKPRHRNLPVTAWLAGLAQAAPDRQGRSIDPAALGTSSIAPACHGAERTGLDGARRCCP